MVIELGRPRRKSASPRATAPGGPAGRSPPVNDKRERTTVSEPAGAERGEGVPASDGARGSGGTKSPGEQCPMIANIANVGIKTTAVIDDRRRRGKSRRRSLTI